MKIMKKAMAFFLCVVMTMAMGISAFAAGETYSITIKGDNVVAGHTYEAYQVFTGTLDSNKTVLSDIDWGTGVDGGAVLDELKSDTTFGSGDQNKFSSCTTAEDVANVLATFDNDSAEARAFAKDAGKHLNTTVAGTTSTFSDSKYVISGLSAGYYLVKDKDGSAPSDDSYTNYIMKVVTDVEVNAKTDTPKIEKKIVEGSTLTDSNTASIGDTINYQVKGSVPDMTGYEKYFYVVNDTMSEGLTFNDDVAITIKGAGENGADKTLVKGTDYTVTASGNTNIKIVFKDFIQYQAANGKDIIITYSATLNEKASLKTNEGNPNKVKLTYSNNPNVTPEGKPGEPDEPGSNDPKGETPEDKVNTYATGLKLTKVDENGTVIPEGAKFQISGVSSKVVMINNEMYKPADNGTYYMLKDGSYTTDAPTEQTQAKYDSTTQKYAKVTEVTKTTKTENVTDVAYVKDGVLTFKSLGEGTYTIKELEAPDGYNKLTEDIVITVKATSKDENSVTWEVKKGNDVLSAEDNLYKFDVVNKSGATLPSTGGMGTTLFYVVGGIMMAGAAVLLVTKRRMTNG